MVRIENLDYSLWPDAVLGGGSGVYREQFGKLAQKWLLMTLSRGFWSFWLILGPFWGHFDQFGAKTTHRLFSLRK